MKIRQSKSFKQQFKKLDTDQQELLQDIGWELSLNPTIRTETASNLKGVWSYFYQDRQGKMQLCYEFDEEHVYLLGIYLISQLV